MEPKLMVANYDGTCCRCGNGYAKGNTVWCQKEHGQWKRWHQACGDERKDGRPRPSDAGRLGMSDACNLLDRIAGSMERMERILDAMHKERR